MKARHFLIGFVVIVICVLACLHFVIQPTNNVFSSQISLSEQELGSMIQLLQAQNHTISTLTNLVSTKHPEMMNLMNSVRQKDVEMEKLRSDLQIVNQQLQLPPSTPVAQVPPGDVSSLSFVNDVEPTEFDMDCESRFGVSLIREWRQKKQVWCDSGGDETSRSTLTCFPYHQKHKQLDGRGEDLFCEATNFEIDFSKVP